MTRKSLIIAKLRLLWLYSVERKVVLENAKEGKLYRCKNCGELFIKKNVNVHHLKPVSKMRNWSWDRYIKNLFESEMVVLCIDCHKKETKKE